MNDFLQRSFLPKELRPTAQEQRLQTLKNRSLQSRKAPRKQLSGPNRFKRDREDPSSV